jgi:hypothetical protein
LGFYTAADFFAQNYSYISIMPQNQKSALHSGERFIFFLPVHYRPELTTNGSAVHTRLSPYGDRST